MAYKEVVNKYMLKERKKRKVKNIMEKEGREEGRGEEKQKSRRKETETEMPCNKWQEFIISTDFY